MPTAPEDYQSVSQEATFRPQSSVILCIPVTIADDATSEPCERFSAMLSGVTPRVKTGNSVSVIINDDDSKWLPSPSMFTSVSYERGGLRLEQS